MDRRMSRSSTEPYGIRVDATTIEGSPRDPTAYPVRMQILPVAAVDPLEGDWKTASWAAGPRGVFAQVMVGPGTDIGELLPGAYKGWVKVLADPEIPELQEPGRLIIF